MRRSSLESKLMFRKVLVANRGEIAVRVLRALAETSIPSVAVYSEVDRAALHVQMADEAVLLGPAAAHESYLRIDKIIAAAKQLGADAVHPGYGFLSENAEFAEACAAAGICFIGPTAHAIRSLGSKTAARTLAIAAGAPVVPGTESAIESGDKAQAVAKQIGYPVLIKASAGGGGKGMRRVDRAEDLEAAIRDASSEASSAFGNGAVYIEKWVEAPRHIEIQVLGDQFGHLIHLGERECSLQRRHQKVLEECPSPLMARHPELRQKMGAAAVSVARAAGYTNAGTVEFLVDQAGNFYFLEMNTRLQVEHPVTELVTALDLVHWQLKIAAGQRLTLKQEDVRWTGHAIECRLYAEDPENGYLPSPGLITCLREPAGPGVRLDSGVYEGWTVPLDYDPLLAKLAVWGETRTSAIARIQRALNEYLIGGIRTNRVLFQDILIDSGFVNGDLSTAFLDQFVKRRVAADSDLQSQAVAALVAALHKNHGQRQESLPAEAASSSEWKTTGREQLFR